jgi:hypothetical protein
MFTSAAPMRLFFVLGVQPLEDFLKWDVVILKFRRSWGCGPPWRLGRALHWSSMGIVTAGGALSAFRPRSKELKVLAHDFHTASFLAAGFVLPSVHTEPAFDVNRAALFGIFTCDFS